MSTMAGEVSVMAKSEAIGRAKPQARRRMQSVSGRLFFVESEAHVAMNVMRRGRRKRPRDGVRHAAEKRNRKPLA